MYNDAAIDYAARIVRAIDDARGADCRISIAQLIPGIAFREIWPFDNGFWSPLDAYIPSREGYPRIPRKSERATAEWLLRSMKRTFDDNADPAPSKVICVGDGEGDAFLAENVAELLKPNGNVTALIYDDGTLLRSNRSTAVHYFDRWDRLAAECVRAIETDLDHRIWLILDVDRTLLLPRGLCKADGIGRAAFSNYLRLFRRVDCPIDQEEIDNAYTFGAMSPLYGTEGGSYHKDEDVRIFSALAFATRLLLPEEILDGSISLFELMKRAVGRCGRSGESPVRQADGSYVTAERDWDREVLLQELDAQFTQARSLDCCFAHTYRHEEERALVALCREERCYLNGHIVDVIRHAADGPKAIPVAYSDRPGASLGLTLMSYHRARPMLVLRDRPLINMSLPLIRETKIS